MEQNNHINMNWDEEIIKGWKELGFYYRLDDYNKQWWLIGSKAGLLNFAEIIEKYAADVRNENVSEHIHLGWYEYLKIVTLDAPLISNDGIGGSINDLRHLKEIIIKNLETKNPGEMFSIGKEYQPESDFSIKFFVMADGFDPSTIDL